MVDPNADEGEDAGGPFSPDWRSPPGATILDLMHARGLTSRQLQEQLALNSVEFCDLIHGRRAITRELAEKLAAVFGPSAEFWLVRDQQYRRP